MPRFEHVCNSFGTNITFFAYKIELRKNYVRICRIYENCQKWLTFPLIYQHVCTSIPIYRLQVFYIICCNYGSHAGQIIKSILLPFIYLNYYSKFHSIKIGIAMEVSLKKKKF